MPPLLFLSMTLKKGFCSVSSVTPMVPFFAGAGAVDFGALGAAAGLLRLV